MAGGTSRDSNTKYIKNSIRETLSTSIEVTKTISRLDVDIIPEMGDWHNEYNFISNLFLV